MEMGPTRDAGIKSAALDPSAIARVQTGSANCPRTMGRFLRRLEWGLVAACYVAVVYAWTLPSPCGRVGPISASLLWVAVMIRTFTFHGTIAVGAITLVALLRRRWRFAAALTPLVLFGFAGDAAELAPARPAPAGRTLRVMSLNLFVGKADPTETLAEIERLDPDVICLQEFNTRADAALTEALKRTHSYSISESTDRVRGSGIFSRYPIDEAASELFWLDNKSGPQARAHVRCGDETITIYSIHLATPSKGPRFWRQRAQFGTLLERLNAETGPLIVCGDFNATNRTDYAGTLAAMGMRDANACVGAGRQSSWPAWPSIAWLPRLRIDHIYLSRELSARTAIIGRPVGSDHSPIVADVGRMP